MEEALVQKPPDKERLEKKEGIASNLLNVSKKKNGIITLGNTTLFPRKRGVGALNHVLSKSVHY